MSNLAFVNKQLESQVAMDAQAVKAKLAAGNSQKGLFIDCGSNLGQGFTFFKKYYPLDSFDYMLIEPNPYCLPHLEDITGKH